MKYLAKLTAVLLIIQSAVLNAGVSGVTDEPNAWGSFPKHFVIGKSHPLDQFLQEPISHNDLKNLVELWNADPDLGVLVTENSGCVFGDLEEDKCTGSYPGGYYFQNSENDIHFRTWPNEVEFEGDLGLTIRRYHGTPMVKEADVFINPSIKWIRLAGIYQCELLSNLPNFYRTFFDDVLVHEVGHAIGLGHEAFTKYSLMTPSSDWNCLPNSAVSIVNGQEIQDKSAIFPLIKPIDFNRLKWLYPQQTNRPFTVDLYVQSPQEGQLINFGQEYTFSASLTSQVSAASGSEGGVTGTESTSPPAKGLTWNWKSNIDGNLGAGETITVNDLSAGWHSITVVASSDDSSEYGETVVSVKVVSDGFYGEDSPVFFPSPCVRSVADPNRGCLLAFSGTIAYPSDGSCGLDYTATFTVENRDTGIALPATKFFGSDNCSTTNRSDNHAWYFWLKDNDDQALVQGTFQGHQPNCTFQSDLCFTSIYTALVPIKSASIELDPTPISCDLTRGATHCSIIVSWSNGKYNHNAGLFYRDSFQSAWVFVAQVHAPSGSITTPEIVDENGIELAIFQYAENPPGNPFNSLPSGRMTELISVYGVPIEDPLFLGEDIVPFVPGQDVDQDSWNVLDNGTTLNLYGNTWKAIDYNYMVTANTWLKFDYKSEGEDSPEIAAVALLGRFDFSRGSSSRTFQVDGTQTSYGNQWFHRYFDNSWKTFDLNVGHVMAGRSIQYMGFVGDIDSPNKQIDISYHNPVLYEKPTTHTPEWGHSGNWYDPETNGQGIALEVNPNNEMVLVEWFTYAENGKDKGASYNRWYLQTGDYDPNGSSSGVNLDIYQNTGGRFNRPDHVTEKVVGTATLRVFDCRTAHLEYDFDTGYNSGRHGYIPLKRITPNIDCSIDEYYGPHKSDFGYTGNWYNPPTSGQGFAFEVNPKAGAVVAQWFTYLPGWSSNLRNPNRMRWFTLAGSYTPGSPSSNSLTIYQNKGGSLDDPHASTETAVGTAHINFNSCTSATIYYDFTGANEFDGLSGYISLVRITNNVTCE